MTQSRRPFGGIERRGTVYRARYHGPDGCRYEAPHLFVARIDADIGWPKSTETSRLTSGALRRRRPSAATNSSPCRGSLVTASPSAT